ncbi:hypothetical protein D3C85_1163200 [compost metagenome]
MASVGKYLWAFIKSHQISNPIDTPPIIIQLKLVAALTNINCSVATAIIANLKMIREDASFNKLSPSRIDEIAFGTLTNFKIAPALTASGGDTIPPNTNPNANEKPGIK